REREALLPRAGDVQIQDGLDACRVLEEAGEDHLMGQAALADESANPALLVTVPDEDERKTREPPLQAAEDLDEEVEALDRVEPADAADHDVGVAEPEALSAQGRFELNPLDVFDVDAIDDDDTLLRAKEAEAEPFEVLGLGDIDDGVAPS